MRKWTFFTIGTALTFAACQGQTVALGGPVKVDTNRPASAAIIVPTGALAQANKVDLLLMIDNSASMGDKQELLRRSIPNLVTRLVAPHCIDANGAFLGRSENGVCSVGYLEFAPVQDLHVGVLTSSLGNRGGDVCMESNPRANDRAHLVVTTADGSTLPNAAGGFLRFGPGGITDAAQLQTDIAALVGGVGATGCGIEAQLEAWYRFLVEPDPYDAIFLDTPPAPPPGTSPPIASDSHPVFAGTDATILQQRHDFLRPDSLLSLVILTDEDDSTVDPISAHGFGWAFNSMTFPASATFRGAATQGTTAPRATEACESSPLSPECTSCGFSELCARGDAPADIPCNTIANDPGCTSQPYYPADRDELNTRFFQMKRRYGVDPQYPIDRYVHGLLSAKVPDYSTDHDANGNYVSAHTCDNPIYAAVLPSGPAEELCHLPPGPRSQKLVVVSVIAGAPPDLLHPGMTNADWTAVVGRDPEAYDFTGIDEHMVPSITPRPGLPPPDAADDADSVHGREWETNNQDLQFACIFALEEPRECTAANQSCDCAGGKSTPLCDPVRRSRQIRAKAYPGIRPLQLARRLGENAVASSICPVAQPTSEPVRPVNYTGAMNELGDRMARSLVPALP